VKGRRVMLIVRGLRRRMIESRGGKVASGEQKMRERRGINGLWLCNIKRKEVCMLGEIKINHVEK
jgi:hypothetical protein